MCFRLLRNNNFLKKLTMKGVEVDDYRKDEFAGALAINTTLNEIDITRYNKMLPARLLTIAVTINDKSFDGEKFCGLLGSSGMCMGKSFAIFSIIFIATFVVFQLNKTATSVSLNESFAFLT